MEVNVNMENIINLNDRILQIEERLSKLDSPLKLKIKRTDEAKEFPLPCIHKEGDVGLDLHTVLPWKEKFRDMSETERDNFLDDQVFDIYYDTKIDQPMEKHEFAKQIRQQVLREMHETITIQPNEIVQISTGIYIELPKDYWAMIKARSGTSMQCMCCLDGVIDGGYRGELFGVLVNIGAEPVEIAHGQRMIQVLIFKDNVHNLEIEEVDELSKSQRGCTGFNSSGKF